MTEADEKVKRLTLKKYRKPSWYGNQDPHLHRCPDAWVESPETGEGSCSEGTCEMLHVEAVIACPHGNRLDFHWSSWDTDLLYAELDEI